LTERERLAGATRKESEREREREREASGRHTQGESVVGQGRGGRERGLNLVVDGVQRSYVVEARRHVRVVFPAPAPAPAAAPAG